MLAALLESFGLRSLRQRRHPPAPLPSVVIKETSKTPLNLAPQISPRELAGEIIAEGDPEHEHQFVPAPWDRDRFGPSVTDFDEVVKDVPIQFPMATFKEAHRCSCGREIITARRSLF